jgi:glycosyltransferase involved in cell wall biosynthesis
VAKVSVIIPSRVETMEISPGENILQRTVRDVYEKASGDIEVIVAFDGPPYCSFPDYKNLLVLELPWQGSKLAINEAVFFSTGKYIMKLDSHCMVGEGFDEILQFGIEDNWIVTPRFYVLDAEKWEWQDGRFYDYFKLPYPNPQSRTYYFQAGGHWKERTGERLNILVDDNMKLHGSCFFMSKHFFVDCIGGLTTDGSGTWNGEDLELTMKAWLGPWGGGLKTNKNTWYAHMHRGGQRPREWHVDTREAYRSAEWSTKYWMGNNWKGRVHDIDWLIEKFWPIPGWPENWKELVKDKYDTGFFRI